jgi:hypothetical protein
VGWRLQHRPVVGVMSQGHALKIEMAANRCQLRHHYGVECVGEVGLLSRISSSARRRCAGGGS